MSAATPPTSVACPQCGTRYRWRDDFAGRELTCRCGAAFLTDAATGEVRASRSAPTSSSASTPLPRALPIGGKSAVERALENREDEAQPSLLRERYLPLALIPLGVAGGFGLWSVVANALGHGVLAWVVAVTLQVVVLTPIAVVAASLVARWFDLGLGLLGTVIFRSFALTLGPAAIGDAMLVAILVNTDFDWSSVIAGYGVYLVLCVVPAMILYEMAIYEAALWLLLIFLPRIVAGYVIVPTMGHLFD